MTDRKAPARDVPLRWKPILMGFLWIALGIALFFWIPTLYPPATGPHPGQGQVVALSVSVVLVLLGTLEIFISNSGPFLYALYGEEGFRTLGANSCPIIVRCARCNYVNMRSRASCARCKVALG